MVAAPLLIGCTPSRHIGTSNYIYFLATMNSLMGRSLPARPVSANLSTPFSRAPTVQVNAERLRLNNLAPAPGSRRREARKGRGYAAGQVGGCAHVHQSGRYWAALGCSPYLQLQHECHHLHLETASHKCCCLLLQVRTSLVST